MIKYQLIWVDFNDIISVSLIQDALCLLDPEMFNYSRSIFDKITSDSGCSFMNENDWHGAVETIQALSEVFHDVIFILEKTNLFNPSASKRFYCKNGIVQEAGIKRIIYESYNAKFFEERENSNDTK